MSFIDPRIPAYAADHTTPPSQLLEQVVEDTEEVMPWPFMICGLAEARLLQALITISGARRVLEVGTFTGFGALAMAAVLPDDGRVVTLERKEETAEVARQHIAQSKHAHKVELIVGDARKELSGLEGPFDIVFIDAWKFDYVRYYEDALELLSPRGLIVADNVLWSGTVVEDGSANDDQGAEVRAFNEHVQADPRVHNVLLTVGDGLMLAWRA